MYQGVVSEFFHYPVKGLDRQQLDTVSLSPGNGFPTDRMCGFARFDSGFDPASPKPLAKNNFFMLMRDERLAELYTHFDPETWAMTVKHKGNVVLDVAMSEPDGRREAEAYFASLLALPAHQIPTFVHADPHRFTDVSVVSTELMNAVSLINLSSVAELGRCIGKAINPARFRANIYFDGWPPFAELDLVGREITIGTVRAKVTLRTRRCAATEVNPETAVRDMPIPRHLKEAYGHSDMGIYVEIIEGGVIRTADPITCPVIAG